MEEREPSAYVTGGGPDAAQVREHVQEQVRDKWSELPDQLTPDEVCHVLRVGRTKLYEELRFGSLHGVAFRWGRRYLIPKKALRRLVEGEDRP